MVIYILKFSACLAIFMVFYKLFLERSSIHKFKRFYLLGALGFALVIPSLTFIEYIEPTVVEEHTTFTMPNIEMVENAPQIVAVNYTSIILWAIYGLGVLIFLLKFCLNLNSIIARIRKNPKLKTDGFINVLVSNLRIPHTFFNYIFFNKHKFELNEIPKEVLLHEQTHAKQKHSIDVLLLEFLQIIFWFNPLLYLLKREVKLNHEFLADHAVLKNGIEPSTYQTILLAFSSKAQHPELANAINYSSIKKRFTVMNTHTSKRSIWVRSLLILPVLALLFYGFTEREQVEIESIPPEIIELYLNEDGELLLENKVITFEDIEALYLEDSKLQVSIKVFPDANPDISKGLTLKLREIGIKKMMVCTSRVAEFQNNLQQKATPKQVEEYNKIAKKLSAQPKKNPIIKLKDVERITYLYKIMSASQKENAQPFPNIPPPPPPPAPPMTVVKKRLFWILLNSKGQFLVNDELATLKSIENDFKAIVNDKNKSNDIVFKHDKKAPKDIINKLNTLIKKYDLENIYDTLPPPPPPPPAPLKKGNGPNGSEYFPVPPPIPEDATPEQREKMQAVIDDFEKTYKRKVHQAKMNDGEMISIIANDDVYHPSQDLNKIKTGFIKIKNITHYYVSIDSNTKYYNRQGFEVNKTGKTISKGQINASNVIPGQYITKVYSDDQVVVEFNNNKPTAQKTRVDIPPPPPAPKSTLDFVIDLAKKNAKFFYEKKEITSDKAISLLKQNPDLNLLAKGTKKAQPLVYISIEPISLSQTKN